ncbi:cell division site-positioning protein MapZ family protein [Streptococcus gallolyticus]|uniref:cell division site-positioning protein MapZ family protein n=1 Tax=Streptococcus gallolyticus TaxID=315405 RepID=UPI002284BDD7|nr:cell division site-positioning protein MapZ family protein [Streptococcus gallolyticus]MCY7185748.1 cell division site-positioning protein MapZ family protein [Streptococcus gallolyticus subsp. gallolyticus]MCY7188962.1 cell division site-positioning protein MapZ family protein [Streptococcus gallolyticus subsp. gallolyticus]
MSDKKELPSSEEQEGLNLEDVKNMTIGEAVRKDSELKAGVTESDGVLDKYIKQHRDEVTSQKFEAKLSDFDDLDTKALDNFIKKQREELVNNGIVGESALKENEATPKAVDFEAEKIEDTQETSQEVPVSEDVASENDSTIQQENVSIEIPNADSAVSEPTPEAASAVVADDKNSEAIALETADEQPTYKNKRVIIGGLAALVVAIFGVAYGLNYTRESSTSVASSSTSTTKKSTSSSSSAAVAKKAKTAFDDAYAAFFTDDTKTKLKNSEFDNISSLKEKLDDLKDTDYYDDAKKEYDTLAAQITAIQTINALFESNVIVNGEKASATVKSDANFDNLSSDLLNTGNANLDTLLQSAITDGKNQLAALASSSSQEASASTSSQTESASSSDTSTTQTVSGASGYGITSYDASTLQRSLSRVPYSDSAIADSSNSAWTFADGVLDKIVATSQSRGYFSGNDYILEKVNIINGNGYYNMFKADGTYLFSINCKTGYFVGNASGNSDALDY